MYQLFLKFYWMLPLFVCGHKCNHTISLMPEKQPWRIWMNTSQWIHQDIDGSVQDSSNSIANILEILQVCTKPSIWCYTICKIMYIFYGAYCIMHRHKSSPSNSVCMIYIHVHVHMLCSSSWNRFNSSIWLHINLYTMLQYLLNHL